MQIYPSVWALIYARYTWHGKKLLKLAGNGVKDVAVLNIIYWMH